MVFMLMEILINSNSQQFTKACCTVWVQPWCATVNLKIFSPESVVALPKTLHKQMALQAEGRKRSTILSGYLTAHNANSGEQ